MSGHPLDDRLKDSATIDVVHLGAGGKRDRPGRLSREKTDMH
jgi:hypothetical protein